MLEYEMCISRSDICCIYINRSLYFVLVSFFFYIGFYERLRTTYTETIPIPIWKRVRISRQSTGRSAHTFMCTIIIIIIISIRHTPESAAKRNKHFIERSVVKTATIYWRRVSTAWTPLVSCRTAVSLSPKSIGSLRPTGRSIRTAWRWQIRSIELYWAASDRISSYSHCRHRKFSGRLPSPSSCHPIRPTLH